MVKTQEEILAMILERTEDNPDKDVNEIVAEVYKELGLSEDALNDYKQSAEIIDGYTENLNEIHETKKNGGTIKSWFLKKWDQLTSMFQPEEKKKMEVEFVNEMGKDLMNEIETSDKELESEQNVESEKGREEHHVAAE